MNWQSWKRLVDASVREKQHCVHKTGTGSTVGWKHFDEATCCRCGKRGHYEYTRGSPAGHGPHAPKVYSGGLNDELKGPCPA